MHLTPKKLLLVFLLPAAFTNVQGQQCSDTAYKIRYFSNDSVYASNHINTSDNGSLVVGEASSYPVKKGLVMKLKATGEVEWSTRLEGPANLSIYKALELKDGSYIVAGTAVQKNPVSNQVFIAKLDPGGRLLWQHFYRLNNNSNLNPAHVYNVSEGIDGDVLICWQRTNINFGINDDKATSLLMRVDRNGALKWSSYLSVGGTYFSNIAGIYFSNNKVIAFGQVYDTSLLCQVNGQGGAFALMEVDYTSGNITRQKNYCFTEMETALHSSQAADHHYNTMQLHDGNFAMFGTFFQRSDKNYHYKVIFDEQFNIVESRLYTTPYLDGALSMIQVMSSGEITITTLYRSHQKAVYGFIDRSDKVLNQKAIFFSSDILVMDYLYNFTFDNFNWTYRERGLNKVSLVNNLTQGNRHYIELTLMSKRQNNLSCLGTDTNFIGMLPFNISATNWSWKTIEHDRVVSDPASFTAATHRFEKEVVCWQMETCDELKIIGTDTVCNTVEPVNYVTRKGSCSKNVSWTFDPAWVSTVTQVNDTIFRVSFKQPVSTTVKTKLYASLSGCIVIDSLEVTLIGSGLQLQADTIICGTVDMMLNAGGEMKSYLWQDGSTASTYHATSKGQYSVKMEDHCGNRFSDTINIHDPFIDLGRDTVICAGDSINLLANRGFMNYNWTAENFVQLTSNSIRISPSTSTRYIVAASGIGGCAAADTIQVQVHPPVTNFIITDTTICSYADLTLRPSSTFRSYLWNDGSTASSLYIDKPGNYWLQVTNQQGCKGKREITVRSKPCSTYIYFPTAFTPDQNGKNDLFRPLITGRVTSYQFEVYNRWGQKVFASSDPNIGWDGTLRGHAQSTGIFIWSCQYQLQGEEKQFKKGTVMLAR